MTGTVRAVRIQIGPRFRSYAPGEVVELPDDEAAGLVEAGLAIVLPDAGTPDDPGEPDTAAANAGEPGSDGDPAPDTTDAPPAPPKPGKAVPVKKAVAKRPVGS